MLGRILEKVKTVSTGIFELVLIILMLVDLWILLPLAVIIIAISVLWLLFEPLFREYVPREYVWALVFLFVMIILSLLNKK